MAALGLPAKFYIIDSKLRFFELPPRGSMRRKGAVPGVISSVLDSCLDGAEQLELEAVVSTSQLLVGILTAPRRSGLRRQREGLQAQSVGDRP